MTRVGAVVVAVAAIALVAAGCAHSTPAAPDVQTADTGTAGLMTYIHTKTGDYPSTSDAEMLCRVAVGTRDAGESERSQAERMNNLGPGMPWSVDTLTSILEYAATHHCEDN